MDLRIEHVVSSENTAAVRFSLNEDGDLKIQQGGDILIVRGNDEHEFVRQLATFVANEFDPTGAE